MPLLYLAGSLLGVALLVLLNVALFGRVKPNVGNAEEMAARLAAELPGFRAGQFAIATDGRAALVENAADRAILLVEALGDGAVTRRLSPPLLARVRRHGANLSLELADFTLPRAQLLLESEPLARDWEARLTA